MSLHPESVEIGPSAPVGKVVRIARRVCLVAMANKSVPDISDEPRERKTLKREIVSGAIRAVGAEDVILSTFFGKRDETIISCGCASIVSVSPENPGNVMKYDIRLVGRSLDELKALRDGRQKEHERVQDHFGDLIHDTTFDIAAVYPFFRRSRPVPTIRSHQAFLASLLDIYSDEASRLAIDPTNEALRVDWTAVAAKAQDWVEAGEWLDVLGTGNIVVTPVEDTWRVRIIDPILFNLLPGEDSVFMTNPIHHQMMSTRVDNLQLAAASL